MITADHVTWLWLDIFEARWIRDGIREAEQWANAHTDKG